MLVALVALSGCSDSSDVLSTEEATQTSGPTQPAPTASAGATDTTASEPAPSTTTVVPSELAGFAVESVRLDGVAYSVAVADTGELRRQGLMGVTDLGSLDGMLFVFGSDTTGGFWMKDTLIPLDIAFFAADGSFVDGFVMEPCTTPSCPTYRPSGAYRYALEVPAGNMPGAVERLEM